MTRLADACSTDPRAHLRARLAAFAAAEAPTSPLNRRLVTLAAARPPLVDLLRLRAACQPPANILLAALQRRLMDRPAAPLARYYPTLGGARAPDDALAAAFDAFWPGEIAALARLIRNRRVATNEIARALVLRLAYVEVARALGERGLPPTAHLVEIGASAGLLLLWDLLAYRYGATTLGSDTAPLTLATDWRSPVPPDRHSPFVPATRLGLDVDPPNLHDAEDVAWLRALIWPEHTERAARFDRMVELARARPPQVRRIDALAYLPDGLDALPGKLPAVVVHAFTVNTFSPAMRLALDRALAEAALSRPVYRIGLEWAPEGARLTLAAYPPGRPRLLAIADPHGAWVRPVG